jgi:hypothetical protein
MAAWRVRTNYGDPKSIAENDHAGDDGTAYYDTHKMQAAIDLHPNLGAVAHVDTWFHELFHIANIVFRLDLSHRDIYNLAAAVAQLAVTSGVINPLAFEAYIRTHAATVNSGETMAALGTKILRVEDEK